MRISFFLGEHKNMDFNTSLEVLRHLEEEEIDLGQWLTENGYPFNKEIEVAKHYPEPEEKIWVICVNDSANKNKEVNKQFVEWLGGIAKEYSGHTWVENPEAFIIRKLDEMEESYPGVRVRTRNYHMHTLDINEDLFHMIINITNL